MSNQEFVSRWGIEFLDDTRWINVPGFILRYYHEVRCLNDVIDKDGVTLFHMGESAELSAGEFAFMVHVMSFKYDSQKGSARPSLQTVSKEMGMTLRGVQKIKKSLIDKGLLIETVNPGKPSEYNFAPLVKQCFYSASFDSSYTPEQKGGSTHEQNAGGRGEQNDTRRIRIEDKEKKTIASGDAGDISTTKKQRQRNTVFDAIATYLFKITDPAAVSEAGGRIGKAEAALRKVMSAHSIETIHVEHLLNAFTRHCATQNFTAPKDPTKITENLTSFIQTTGYKPTSTNGNGAHTPPAQRTPEEIARENEELDRILAPKDIFGTKSKENGQ